jgi:hypothetical protein
MSGASRRICHARSDASNRAREALPFNCLDETLRKDRIAMQQLTRVSRWAKRTLSLFLLAGAFVMPLKFPQVRSTASQVAQGALAVAPRPLCPGSGLPC